MRGGLGSLGFSSLLGHGRCRVSRYTHTQTAIAITQIPIAIIAKKLTIAEVGRWWLLVYTKNAHLFPIPNERGLSKTTITTILFLNMNVLIETSRLLIRTFTINDAGLIYELNKNPEVTRYTGDPITSIEHAAEVLEKTILPQYALYNHGRWAVHIKQDLTFIGWCGLKFRPERNEVDLGYRFLPAYWGTGYATEAAFATLKYGFEQLHLPRIFAAAELGNKDSWRVLEKCGMQYIGDELIDGHMARTYELLNPSIR